MPSMWLTKALGIKNNRWWVENYGKLPLLTEIRESLEQQKCRKGSGSKLSKKVGIVVAIKIREKVLFVVNHITSVTLAFTEDTVKESIHWLLNQILKDKETLADMDAPVGRLTKKDEQSPEGLQFFGEAVEDLRSHSSCARAHYLPSLRSIQVIKKDKAVMKIRINGMTPQLLKAVPGEGSLLWDEAKKLLDEALSKCLKFLDGNDSPDGQIAEPVVAEDIAE